MLLALLPLALAQGSPALVVVDGAGAPVRTAVVVSSSGAVPVDATGRWTCTAVPCPVAVVQVRAPGFRPAEVSLRRRGQTRLTLTPLDPLPPGWVYGPAQPSIPEAPIHAVHQLAALPPAARSAWDSLFGATAERDDRDWDPSCSGGGRPRFVAALNAGNRWVFAVENGGFGVSLDVVQVEVGPDWTWLDGRGFPGGTAEATWRAAIGWR